MSRASLNPVCLLCLAMAVALLAFALGQLFIAPLILWLKGVL